MEEGMEGMRMKTVTVQIIVKEEWAGPYSYKSV
jgi:hypothetical protein